MQASYLPPPQPWCPPSSQSPRAANSSSRISLAASPHFLVRTPSPLTCLPKIPAWRWVQMSKCSYKVLHNQDPPTLSSLISPHTLPWVCCTPTTLNNSALPLNYHALPCYMVFAWVFVSLIHTASSLHLLNSLLTPFSLKITPFGSLSRYPVHSLGQNNCSTFLQAPKVLCISLKIAQITQHWISPIASLFPSHPFSTWGQARWGQGTHLSPWFISGEQQIVTRWRNEWNLTVARNVPQWGNLGRESEWRHQQKQSHSLC